MKIISGTIDSISGNDVEIISSLPDFAKPKKKEPIKRPWASWQVMGSMDTCPESASVYADGKDLPHYCGSADKWCSEKLPGSNHPAGCIKFKCEHYELKEKPL